MFVLGNGSNLLVADGEHDVLGVHLVGEFEELRTRDEGDVVVVDAGAGLDLPIAARRLAKSGVAGFEWAVGVPGSFGGAAVMNAGGHGSDMNDVAGLGHGLARRRDAHVVQGTAGLRLSHERAAPRRPGDLGAPAPSRRRQRRRPRSGSARSCAGGANTNRAGRTPAAPFATPRVTTPGDSSKRPAARGCASAPRSCRRSTRTSSSPTPTGRAQRRLRAAHDGARAGAASTPVSNS